MSGALRTRKNYRLIVHLLANLAGILAPSLTGYLVQYGGGYAAAFTFAGVLAGPG